MENPPFDVWGIEADRRTRSMFYHSVRLAEANDREMRCHTITKSKYRGFFGASAASVSLVRVCRLRIRPLTIPSIYDAYERGSQAWK